MKVDEIFDTPQFWKPCTAESTDWYRNWAGGWINERGEIILVDQPRDYHHANAALDAFQEYIEPNEQGEHDEHSESIAMNMAFEQGWLTYRYIKPYKEFSATWNPEVSKKALRELAEIIKEEPDFGVYLFSTYEGNEQFRLKREAIRYVMQWLQS